MTILGIETSCDETAAAVVKDGREVLSNVVYTQIPLHQPYGGVVPEIASRAHVEKISEVIRTALTQVPGAWCLVPGAKEDSSPALSTKHQALSTAPKAPSTKHYELSTRHLIDAIAVTYGPGLSPALIVGLNAAKGLALSLGVPLIAINHIEAHLHTPFLVDAGEPVDESLDASFPALGLAISGGHTNWFDISAIGDYRTFGQTLDDAAGEAFDKAAKLLGLGYPGGPKVDKIAKAYRAHIGDGDLNLVPFPKGRPRDGVTALAGLPAELCVSFSGLKTALLRYVQQHPEILAPPPDAPRLAYTPDAEVTVELARVVTSYQEAIVQAVADRTRTALKRRAYKSFILGGGVSLNSRLRTVLGEVAAQAGIPLLMAKPKYCGDNGAMIAGLAYFRRNLMDEAALALDVAPSLEVGA